MMLLLGKPKNIARTNKDTSRNNENDAEIEFVTKHTAEHGAADFK